MRVALAYLAAAAVCMVAAKAWGEDTLITAAPALGAPAPSRPAPGTPPAPDVLSSPAEPDPAPRVVIDDAAARRWWAADQRATAGAVPLPGAARLAGTTRPAIPPITLDIQCGTETGRTGQTGPTGPTIFRVTAYCPCRICCGPGAKGITASGRPVTANGGRFVAADWKILPQGTLVRVPGYPASPSASPRQVAGEWVPVLDKGGAIKGNRIDVFFATHAEARRWGVRTLTVEVLPCP